MEQLPHPQHGLPAVSHRLAEIRTAGSGLIAPPGTAGRLRDARPGQAIPLVGMTLYKVQWYEVK